MAPFFYLPHTIYVAEHGLAHFELSMQAQEQLTKRFTAEFSIRAFIAQEPERTFAQLHRWAVDDNPHVRRLVSEGTRSRLPWASRVAWLDDNPARVLELLELLKHDPTTLVRRSVANNLNDLSKRHPELVVATCVTWAGAGTPEMAALVRHALRSLVKSGHRGALAVLGTGKRPRVQVRDVALAPKTVSIGGELRFSFALHSSAGQTQELLVDYAVHFVKANGTLRRKVFKLGRVTLAAKDSTAFSGKVSFAPMTTRKHYPGRHELEVLVNGEVLPLGQFDVR
jgi:3-methyladenine DNA glycosylase AlkC